MQTSCEIVLKPQWQYALLLVSLFIYAACCFSQTRFSLFEQITGLAGVIFIIWLKWRVYKKTHSQKIILSSVPFHHGNSVSYSKSTTMHPILTFYCRYFALLKITKLSLTAKKKSYFLVLFASSENLSQYKAMARILVK